MLKIKRVLSLFLILAVILTILLSSGTAFSAAGTGTGLAEHVLNAYYSGWQYVYGGASENAVDCSGLIYMYAGNARGGNSQFNASPETGSIGSLPNIHGLGLYQDGHVGVYIGNGMAVDARDSASDVCLGYVANKTWTHWYKVAGVSYPTTGWEYFNGSYYYYENGEYLTSTTITVDGVDYYLDASGASNMTPGDTSGIASTGTSSNSSNSSSNSNADTSASKIMKLGSSGDNVVKLQQRLAELGFFNDEATGYFGSVTEAAYKMFQTAAGVVVDGIAGESDLEILYSDNAPYAEVTPEEETPAETEAAEEEVPETTEAPEEQTTFTNGDYHDGVYDIQSELANLGYFNDEATGYYGDYTQAAVAEFQTQNGLKPTGEVDELTYAAIFSSTALENPYTEDTPKDAETLVPPKKTNKTTVSQNTTEASEESEQIALKSAQLSAKALEGVEFEGVEADRTTSKTGSFAIWLVVMIAFMSAAFWFVFSNEKKKKKARYERIKARANRNW